MNEVPEDELDGIDHQFQELGAKLDRTRRLIWLFVVTVVATEFLFC
jgi:hypothetical protein